MDDVLGGFHAQHASEQASHDGFDIVELCELSCRQIYGGIFKESHDPRAEQCAQGRSEYDRKPVEGWNRICCSFSQVDIVAGGYKECEILKDQMNIYIVACNSRLIRYGYQGRSDFYSKVSRIFTDGQPVTVVNAGNLLLCPYHRNALWLGLRAP